MWPTKQERLPEIGDGPIVGSEKVVIFCNLDPLTSNLCKHYEKEQQEQLNLWHLHIIELVVFFTFRTYQPR